MVYAPEPAADGAPYRLVLLLHGAGGSARQGLDLLLPVADAHRLLLVAPQAAASSWDLIGEGFGVDVRRIDGLLGHRLRRLSGDAAWRSAASPTAPRTRSRWA